VGYLQARGNKKNERTPHITKLVALAPAADVKNLRGIDETSASPSKGSYKVRVSEMLRENDITDYQVKDDSCQRYSVTNTTRLLTLIDQQCCFPCVCHGSEMDCKTIGEKSRKGPYYRNALKRPLSLFGVYV
jgi:hypothetical protein